MKRTHGVFVIKSNYQIEEAVLIHLNLKPNEIQLEIKELASNLAVKRKSCAITDSCLEGSVM